MESSMQLKMYRFCCLPLVIYTEALISGVQFRYVLKIKKAQHAPHRNQSH